MCIVITYKSPVLDGRASKPAPMARPIAPPLDRQTKMGNLRQIIRRWLRRSTQGVAREIMGPGVSVVVQGSSSPVIIGLYY